MMIKKSLTRAFIPSLLEPRSTKDRRKQSLTNRNTVSQSVNKIIDSFSEQVHKYQEKNEHEVKDFNDEDSASSLSDSSDSSESVISDKSLEKETKDVINDKGEPNQKRTQNSKRVSLFGDKINKRNILQINTKQK